MKKLNKETKRKELIKPIILFLIIAFYWLGLSNIGKTFSYFSNTEKATENILQIDTLDFSLNSPDDFSPILTPTATSTRNINVINNGLSSFQYTARAKNIDGDLCDYLSIYNNITGETQNLINFVSTTTVMSDPQDNWDFSVALNSDNSNLKNQTCNFDLAFQGWQNNIEKYGDGGFSDEETISNTVVSGEWSAPSIPGDSDDNGDHDDSDDSDHHDDHGDSDIPDISEVNEYSPIIDSYIQENAADSNYGSSQELIVRSKNCPNPMENKRAFLKFDFQLPENTTVFSSALKLYMNSAPSSSRIHEVRRVLENWTERDPNGIDWNNQPDVSDDLTSSTSTGATAPYWISWDVTSDVQNFVSQNYDNYGWRLNDSAESSPTPYEAKFYSRESESENLRPVLEINFSVPAATTAYPVINEVYYDVNDDKGDDPRNEWVEIYNPTDSAIDISGWKICDNNSCETIPTSTPISAKGFAVISGEDSTWTDFWTMPSGAILIDLSGDKIGDGLSDNGDRLILKNISDTVIDAMSYGNDNSQLNPAVSFSGKGKSLARIIKGYDTDSAADWVVNIMPNPGTNPSEGGAEIMRFTSEGIEVANSEENLTPLAAGKETVVPEIAIDEILDTTTTAETLDIPTTTETIILENSANQPPTAETILNNEQTTGTLPTGDAQAPQEIVLPKPETEPTQNN